MKEPDLTISEMRTLKLILSVMHGKLSKQARLPNGVPGAKCAVNGVFNALSHVGKALNHILRENGINN